MSIKDRLKISKVSPLFASMVSPFLARWLVLFVGATVVWGLVWICYYDDLLWRFYFVVPAFGAALLVSIILFKKPRLRFISALVCAGPVALFLLFKLAWLISFPLTEVSTYYLGMDVNTPSGLKTCKSMVQYSDFSLPWWLKRFRTRGVKLRGEAAYCDLGNGKAAIALLVFEKDLEGKKTLTQLPQLASSPPLQDSAFF